MTLDGPLNRETEPLVDAANYRAVWGAAGGPSLPGVVRDDDELAGAVALDHQAPPAVDVVVDPPRLLPRPGLRPRVAPPPTRGWTPFRIKATIRHDGSPAHAGMDLLMAYAPVVGLRLPRPRGDGPSRLPAGIRGLAAPPPTRGWTDMHSVTHPHPHGSPAHAGMDL